MEHAGFSSDQARNYRGRREGTHLFVTLVVIPFKGEGGGGGFACVGLNHPRDQLLGTPDKRSKIR